ncbi:MAG: integrin alpha [Actinomycetota bacterium]
MRRILVLAVVTMGAVAFTAPPSAASCAGFADPKKQRRAHVEGADVIFTGVATKVEVEQSDDHLFGDERIRTHFRVETGYKGPVRYNEVVNNGQTGSSITQDFEAGRRYTVFADLNKRGVLSTNVCAGNKRGSINPDRWGLKEKRNGAGGAADLDRAGSAVAGLGDLDGDGRVDYLVGAPFADVPAPPPDYSGRLEDAGEAYVLFGRDRIGTVNLKRIGFFGYRVQGAAAGDRAGFSVANAGDVNGDGRTDLLVGAPGASNNDRVESGSAYVVFDRPEPPGPFNLRDLGDDGFRIDGASSGDQAGFAVAGAGDVNGDGLADVLVGAPATGIDVPLDPDVRAGSAYVVFGKASSEAVDLAALGDGGYTITGERDGDSAGRSVSPAGDVNDDGSPDAIVGAPLADRNERTKSGSAYVVFGKASSEPVDLGALGEGGFRIDGAAPFDAAGWAVSTAGDFDSDGRADVIVGAPGLSEVSTSGAAYVVLGHAAQGDVDLASGEGVIALAGTSIVERFGWSVAPAGDADGDGAGDVVVGAPSNLPGENEAGRAYVFSFSGLVRMSSDGRVGDRYGFSVAPLGDISGDGTADLVIGAPGARYRQREQAGRAHIEF